MHGTIVLSGIKVAVATATITGTVTPGQTLSGIAQEYHVPGGWQALCAANHLEDCNVIHAGQTLVIPGSSGDAAYAAPSVSAAPAPASSPSSTATVTGGSGGFSIPGVPGSLTSCIASRESNNMQDPAAGGNAYGILPGSGYDVSGMSLARQKQVFQEIYQSVGASAWAWDGCPGT